MQKASLFPVHGIVQLIIQISTEWKTKNIQFWPFYLQRAALFPSHFSQYIVLSNQLPKLMQNEKNYIILAILFTHSCTHSLTVCKIITFSRPVKFLYLRLVNKMFQCQIFAELCVIKMDLFNRLDLESNKKSLQIMNLQYACGCFWQYNI